LVLFSGFPHRLEISDIFLLRHSKRLGGHAAGDTLLTYPIDNLPLAKSGRSALVDLVFPLGGCCSLALHYSHDVIALGFSGASLHDAPIINGLVFWRETRLAEINCRFLAAKQNSGPDERTNQKPAQIEGFHMANPLVSPACHSLYFLGFLMASKPISATNATGAPREKKAPRPAGQMHRVINQERVPNHRGLRPK
jgi:hypothetical protein